MGEPVIVFRSAIIHLWWTMTKWISLIVGIIIAVHIQANGMQVQIPPIVNTAVSGVLVATFLAGAIAYYRIYLSGEGIRGYDVFGFYHLAKWDAIEEVRPINLLGLKYLRVRLNDGHRPLWVPIFLNDVNGFGETVARLAGPDNPLTRSWPREPRRTSKSPISQPQAASATSQIAEPART